MAKYKIREEIESKTKNREAVYRVCVHVCVAGTDGAVVFCWHVSVLRCKCVCVCGDSYSFLRCN